MKERLPFLTALAFITFVLGFAPGSATADDTVGVPWTGSAGTNETVAQIMARENQLLPQANAAARQTHRRLLPSDRQPAEDGRRQAKRPIAAFVPPRQYNQSVNPQAGPFNPQTVGTGFLGAQISDTIGYIPPDSMGAVGPSQVLVIVNGRIKVFDKNGILGALNATTDTFFNSVRSTSSTSDPHVRYDRLSGRWFIVMINVKNTSNRILIAVSNSSTITDATSFTFFQFVGQSSDFTDYPTLGVDKFALYIGANIFTSGTGFFSSTKGFVVNKTNLLAGTLSVTTFANLHSSSGDGMLTPQGVDNDDPSATEGYFIGVSSFVGSELVIRRISNPGGSPSISGNLTIAVPSIADPISQVATQSTANLDALDTRLFAAAIHKNKITGSSTLWTAHNIEVNNSGAGATGGGRNGSRWYEIGTLTAAPSLVQSGTLFDPASSNPRGYWIPSVAASGQGHMALGCSYASANDFAGVAVAGRLWSDSLGSTQSPTLAVVSSTAYNVQSTVQRWGDFSQVAVDPNDDMTMWTFQEYCNAVNSWGVRAIQLKAPPPATPASASPASVVQGQSSVNVVITGTSASGSEFFDPGPDTGGPGFANHIAAAVNGGGVTVNSVTFSNATNITINVTVAGGATPGARTITVTNPDGQIATSASGILTINTSGLSANFVGGPTNGMSPLIVTFTNLSTGATNYSWDFGDGHVSTATNAANTYSNAGSYTVSLQAVGQGGTDTLVRNNYVVLSNAPPILAAIADKIVLEETLLTFTASASDPDVNQTLAFSLDPPVPEGASINPGSGVFTWTPSLAFASTTNSITVRVTDDGSPAAFDLQAFNVTVVAKPRLLSIAESPDGFFTLMWQVYPGRTYRSEFKTNLTDAIWTALATNTAATSSAVLTNDAGANFHKFYRVLDVTGP